MLRKGPESTLLPLALTDIAAACFRVRRAGARFRKEKPAGRP